MRRRGDRGRPIWPIMRSSPRFRNSERPVFRMRDGDRAQTISSQYRGVSVNALTFRRRTEKLGWTKGSTGDGGTTDTHCKIFPGAGTLAILGVNGMCFGMGAEATVTLQDFSFFRIPNPNVTEDPLATTRSDATERLIPFGDVPPGRLLGSLCRSGPACGSISRR